MHIHGHLMNLQVTGTSFAAAENAATRQRAGDVRKKLLKRAQSVEAELSPEARLMVGQWLDSRHSQVQSEG